MTILKLAGAATAVLALAACNPSNSTSTATTVSSTAASTATAAATDASATPSASASPATSASGPAASPAPTGPLPAWMTDAHDTPAAAEAYVRGLYARYTDVPGGTDANRPEFNDDNLFAPAMLALMREDARLANGEVGYMDADPICQCQDWQNLSVNSVTLTGAGPARADAAVAFTNAGHAVRLTLKLQLTPQGWRVADVIGGAEPHGLAASLTRANAEAARAPASGSGSAAGR